MNEFLATATGFILLAPAALLLVLALVFAAWWRARRPPPALLFAPARFLDGLPRSLRQRWGWTPRAFEAVALALLMLALARPAERVALPRRSVGVDLMLALDRSSSMNEHDLDPTRSRLEVARVAAQQFVAARPGDRIGLIGFARYPDLLCAPTLDRAELDARLTAWDAVAADGPEDLTGIGAAAARAAEILRRAPSPSKVLVIFTDGEENLSGAHAPQTIGPAEAAELCLAWGVRVHLIAAGSALSTRGSAVESLATATGGMVYRATEASELERAFAAIDAMEVAPLEDPRHSLHERAAWPAGAALVLFTLAAWLRRRLGEVLP